MLSQETAVQTHQILSWSSTDRLAFYARKPLESDAAVDSTPSPTLQSSRSDQETPGRMANAPRSLETRKP